MRSIPAGYAPALAGAALFLAAALGDLSWHLAFGVERDIAALLSPTHLSLFAGGLLIVTAPLRLALADPTLALALAPGRRPGQSMLLPAVLSATLAGCATAFMFQYLHPAWEDVVGRDRGRFLRQTFDAAQYHFVNDQNVIVGAAGKLGGRVVVRRVSRSVCGSCSSSVTVPFWGVYFGGVAAYDHGLGWPAELWGGAIIWSGLTFLALALMTVPPRAPTQETTGGVGCAVATGQKE